MKGLCKKIMCWSMFLGVFLLALYLFQVEDFIEKNYLIEKRYLQIKSIEQGNLVLEQESLETSLLANIEQRARELGFVNVSQIRYIPISVDYLARESY